MIAAHAIVCDCPITIRAASPNDEAFIFATWLKSFRAGGIIANGVVNSVFFPNHHAVIEAAMRRSSVVVAHPGEDPDTILGYAVAERPDVLHWCYVKPAWRRLGIAARMLAELGIDRNQCQYTHRTVRSGHDDSDGLFARYPGAVYNPYRM